MDIRAAAMLLVVGAVLLIVGIYTEATIYSSINTSSLPTESQQAIQDVQSHVTSGFKLAGIGLIVVGAAFIIKTLLGAF